MNEWNLIFEIEPQVKQRPRITRWGSYTPKETAEFEKKVKGMAKELWNEDLLLGPLEVRFRFVCTKPKKPSKPYPRGDTDNFAKAMSDALNEVVWCDDSQIVSEHSTKEYGELGRVYVRIRMLLPPLEFL